MNRGPTIIAETDPASLLRAVRHALEEEVAAGERICLPTGRTPAPLYAAVAGDPAARERWQSWRYLQLDEYIDPPAGTESFAATLARQLFDPLEIPLERRGAITVPGDPAEGARLDRLHAESGLALCLLGLGSNGHIAFNEPGDTTAGYHRVTLAEETVRANCGANLDRPVEALTIGIDQILAARRVLLWVPQPDKQDLLDRVLAGPIDPALPATALLAHERCTVFRLAR